MILILSQEFEPSTDYVLDWLDFYDINYFRVNGNDKIQIIEYQLNNSGVDFILKINGKLIQLKDISAYWYRRGYINLEDYNEKLSNLNNNSLTFYLSEELVKLRELLDFSLKKKYHLGSFLNNNINKYNNLQIAKKNGLSIPDSIITSDKKRLTQFINQYHRVITKPINESFSFEYNKDRFMGYTQLIEKNDLTSIPEIFTPTLFQNAIEKYCELRIFYLNGNCYSMAIFSQNDEQTKIDFRNYNHKKPNRTIPFNLPTSINKKIKSFMIECGYLTGSIDIVLTPKNEYVFLEVNPVGLFEQISEPCNYYLHEKIANYLVKKK